MAMQHHLVEMGDQKNLVVVLNGEMLVADNQHPNWPQIYKAVVEDENEDGLKELFDVQSALNTRFNRVSERVSVRNGKVYFDGDEVDDALTKQILKFLNQDVNDWQPLVLFMENVASNPSEHSRSQLYDFLARREFTIDKDGNILGYKGVTQDENGVFWSINSGTAIVNGEVKEGRIPQEIGDIVEMPRSEVAWNPAADCASGLHVSHFQYAHDFSGSRSNSAVLLVRVNPRDVVSVPYDASFQKVRVCRYEVVGAAEDGSLEADAVYQPRHSMPEEGDGVVLTDEFLPAFTPDYLADDSYHDDEDDEDEWEDDDWDDEDDSWDNGYDEDSWDSQDDDEDEENEDESDTGPHIHIATTPNTISASYWNWPWGRNQ